jgi:capsular polysaccharide biosynthesis protein
MGTGTPGVAPGRGGLEGEYVLSLGDLFGVVKRRAWVIALTALVLAALTIGYGLFLQTPQYEASAKVLIGQRQGDDQGSSLGGNVQGLQDLMVTMTETAKTRPVAETVIQRLDLSVTPNEFLQNLRVEQVPSTQVIVISYEDPSRERAQQVANGVGEAFSNQVSRFSEDVYAVTATVVERAIAPRDPVSPQPLRNGLLALALGTILGVGLAFLLEHLDDSWRSPEEVEQISGVPTFGVIPEFRLPKVKDKAQV